MAKNDDLAARYPDLLGDESQADHELIETVRALDTLYTAPAPAKLDTLMTRLAERQTATPTSDMGATPRLRRREVDTMRVLRTAESRRWTGIVAAAAACLVVGLLAALLIGGRGGPGMNPGSGAGPTFTQQGGLRINALTSCASTSNAASCSLTSAMPKEGDILTHRFASELNVTSVKLQVISDTNLLIELQGATNTKAVVPLLAQGNVVFLDTKSVYVPPGTQLDPTSSPYSGMFKGMQVDPTSVSIQMDRQTGQPVVTFTFAGSARQAFAQYTAEHIGKYLTITLDGVVIESAVIQSAIDGAAQISGLGSMTQAKQVVAALKYGPLPVRFQTLMVATIDPRGQVSCTQSTPQPGGTPISTPTPLPDAPTPAPTYTPWPVPTPLGAPTPTPGAGPGPSGTNGSLPVVVMVCGTATAGPTAPASSAPGNLATPTMLPTP